MGKNQSASNLTNIIKQDASGNITFVSGSTTLMSVSSSGAIVTTGNVAGTASYASNADLLDGLDSTVFTLTSSFAAQTASFTAFTASQNILNGTYATTGSNTFAGIQTVNSNLIVTGSITAQTLVVQTITSSVDFVTGSTRFGSLSSNTHVFTGSMNISGSSNFSGSVTATDLIISDTYVNDPLIKLVTTTSGNVEVQMRTATTTYNAGIGVVTSGYDFGLFTNNTTRMTITSAGNVGIGVTPNTWNSAYKSLQIGASLSLLQDGSSVSSYWGGNLYVGTDGNYKYTLTGTGGLLGVEGNSLVFYNASSGTAGNTASITERFRVSTAGAVISTRANIGGPSDDADISLNVSAPSGSGKYIMFGRNSSNNAVFAIDSSGNITTPSIGINNAMTLSSQYLGDVTTSWVSTNLTTLYVGFVFVYWANSVSGERNTAVITCNYYPSGVTTISQSNNGGNGVQFQMNGSTLQIKTTSGTAAGVQLVYWKV